AVARDDRARARRGPPASAGAPEAFVSLLRRLVASGVRNPPAGKSRGELREVLLLLEREHDLEDAPGARLAESGRGVAEQLLRRERVRRAVVSPAAARRDLARRLVGRPVAKPHRDVRPELRVE